MVIPVLHDMSLRKMDRFLAHLSSLLKSVGGDVPLALAAYHAGLSRVKKRMALPAIRSTVDYVNLIMFYYTGEKNYIIKYSRIYGDPMNDFDYLY